MSTSTTTPPTTGEATHEGVESTVNPEQITLDVFYFDVYTINGSISEERTNSEGAVQKVKVGMKSERLRDRVCAGFQSDIILLAQTLSARPSSAAQKYNDNMGIICGSEYEYSSNKEPGQMVEEHSTGVAAVYKKNIRGVTIQPIVVRPTVPLDYGSICLVANLRNGSKVKIICICVYRPGQKSGSASQKSVRPFCTKLKELIEKARQPTADGIPAKDIHIVLTGNFNVHLDSDTDQAAHHLRNELEEIDFVIRNVYENHTYKHCGIKHCNDFAGLCKNESENRSYEIEMTTPAVEDIIPEQDGHLGLKFTLTIKPSQKRGVDDLNVKGLSLTEVKKSNSGITKNSENTPERVEAKSEVKSEFS